MQSTLDIRIRVNGEKVDLKAWDIIEVDAREVDYYLQNWFKIVQKETTEVIDESKVEEKKKQQALDAKASIKKK